MFWKSDNILNTLEHSAFCSTKTYTSPPQSINVIHLLQLLRIIARTYKHLCIKSRINGVSAKATYFDSFDDLNILQQHNFM